MDGDAAPRDLLRAGSLVPLTGQVRPRQGRAFLVDWKGTRAILRSVPSPGGLDANSVVADVRWLHTFLTRLTALGFPAPAPLPAFAGASSVSAGGEVWEIVSFLPGVAVGWSARPPLEEIGALLARYHATVRRIDMPAQRPSALPLTEVPAILLSAWLDNSGIGANRVGVIRQLAERLGQLLDDAGLAAHDQVVIHGDFTNDNVLSSGSPQRVTGVIDFALAHADSPMADIGYALWRSGRPAEQADHVDLRRLRRYLQGYASAGPLPADQADIVPVFLMGRGLQMLAKRIGAGRPETGMLPQVQWLSANFDAISDAVRQAVS